MKNTRTYAKRLATLLRKIKTTYQPEVSQPAEPATQLVIAFLQWNASRQAAREAHHRLMDVMVDNNELRVTHPHEVAVIIGPRYPRVAERTERLHDTLNDIYLLEQNVSIDRLADLSKKDVRAYLDRLHGITPFVAAQVILLCFGAHAVPVDDQLAELLRAHQLVDETAALREIESFLERHIKADVAAEAHAGLTAWVEAGKGRVEVISTTRRASKRTKQTTKKKTTKKTVS